MTEGCPYDSNPNEFIDHGKFTKDLDDLLAYLGTKNISYREIKILLHEAIDYINFIMHNTKPDDFLIELDKALIGVGFKRIASFPYKPFKPKID